MAQTQRLWPQSNLQLGWCRFFDAIKIQYNGLQDFSPNLKISIESGQFYLRTAENLYDLKDLFKLRYDVFLRSIQKKPFATEMDIDGFDRLADHLMIFSKTTNKLVGTYRILSSSNVKHFYSESEFRILGREDISGNFLELGRACVREEHRNGGAITLLWRGLSQAIKHHNAKYLFGCSSINVEDLESAQLLYRYLYTHYQHQIIQALPHGKYEIIKDADKLLSESPSLTPEQETSVQKLFSPLLRTYLMAGAKICGPPALDKDFRCLDFLTVLDVESISPNFKKKFLGSRP